MSAVLPLYLAVFSACGNGTGDASSPTTPSSIASDEFSIDNATLVDARKSASDFQLLLINDSKLTLSEYEEAKLAQMKCVQDAGLTIVGSTQLNGIYQYSFHFVADSALAPIANDIISKCTKEYSNIIDMLWAGVSAPLAAQTIQDSRHDMALCILAKGLRVEDRPWSATDATTVSDYGSCRSQIQSQFNLDSLGFGVEGDEAYRGNGD